MSAELLVQRFLRDGGDLSDLQERYGLNVTFHPDVPNLVMFKYDMIDSPMGESLVQQCRGLILDAHRDWEVVARPFDKFFNYGEGHAAQIDWSTARVQRKLDGSLMIMYYYAPMEGWMVASSGHPSAAGNVHGNPMTFNQLFWQTFRGMSFLLPPRGCEEETFLFELTSPLNRIVVPHDSAKLTLLAVRDRKTGRWVERERWELFYPTVEEYPLQSIEDVIASFEKLDPLFNEGYVVVDATGNRIKVKHPGYVALHRAKDGFSPKAMLEIVRNAESSEVLSYFPEWKNLYEKIALDYDALVAELELDYQRLKDLQPQKTFALEAIKTRVSSAMFYLRNGKSKSVKDHLANIQIDNLMEYLKIGSTP